MGPLHLLPISDHRFGSVTLDFVGPLPMDEGFNQFRSMTCRAGADIQILPTRMNQTDKDFARIFFRDWYCENSLPYKIITDCNVTFTSAFWKALMKLTGVKHKTSTSFHPQTDGASEHSNKTIVQCIHYHVDCLQTGWVSALPQIRFGIMNTVNASMEYSAF